MAAALIVAPSPVASGAALAAPKEGLYRGKTAQGARVAFRVRDGRVVRPSFTVVSRGCGVQITFTEGRRVNRRGRFFFGRRSSDFFAGRFVAGGRVLGKAGVDFPAGACPGRGVREARFRARRVG
jgi:hypothetical protein